MQVLVRVTTTLLILPRKGNYYIRVSQAERTYQVQRNRRCDREVFGTPEVEGGAMPEVVSLGPDKRCCLGALHHRFAYMRSSKVLILLQLQFST